ncbi:hypothetical protein [Izhakiella capsodis]|uniref:hypothetical protein n=1 Tax=Izhakiella capsodis TaxID=1367852 RepID=UPI0015A66B31|nr:hypothetical protein [Izhakiella capsodis]
MENIVIKTATVYDSTRTQVVPMVSTEGGEDKSTQHASPADFLADAAKKGFSHRL